MMIIVILILLVLSDIPLVEIIFRYFFDCIVLDHLKCYTNRAWRQGQF